MKVYLKGFISSFVCILLTGCIGENYDAGPPHAYLKVGSSTIRLTESTVSWSTQSVQKQFVSENIQKLTEEQQLISVSSRQHGTLEFEDSLDEGGDYADVSVRVKIFDGKKRTDLPMNEDMFYFPEEKGAYRLEVSFNAHAGRVEYVGNVEVE